MKHRFNPGRTLITPAAAKALAPKDVSAAMLRHLAGDYAGEPPSSRTSHSHDIRLYGSTRWRMVNTLTRRCAPPLAKLVKLGLPGRAARLDDVSYVFRH